MKNFKITNFTIKDWCVLAISIFAVIVLVQFAFENIMQQNYWSTTRNLLGAAGWVVIYYNKHKGIADKNPQN